MVAKDFINNSVRISNISFVRGSSGWGLKDSRFLQQGGGGGGVCDKFEFIFLGGSNETNSGIRSLDVYSIDSGLTTETERGALSCFEAH